MTDIFSVGLQKTEKSLMNESGIVALGRSGLRGTLVPQKILNIFNMINRVKDRLF